MTLRKHDLHAWKYIAQLLGQNRANHIFRWKMSCVDEIDALRLGVQKNIIFYVCGNKGITSQLAGQGQHIPAGAAANGHPTDGTPRVHIAYPICPQCLFYLCGIGCRIHARSSP